MILLSRTTIQPRNFSSQLSYQMKFDDLVNFSNLLIDPYQQKLLNQQNYEDYSTGIRPSHHRGKISHGHYYCLCDSI